MPQNCNFSSKILPLIFCQEIAVLRHLEWFFGKIIESRPPLKLKNNGGLLSDIFSRMLLSKDTMVRGQGPNPKIFEKLFL